MLVPHFSFCSILSDCGCFRTWPNPCDIPCIERKGNFMKNKLFALVAIVFASFIQVGCGNQNPNQNTLGYNQYQNGCPVGQTFVNGMCTYTGNNTNYQNNGSCTSGASYQPGAYGCTFGYVMQGNQCVCQATITGTGTQNGGCQQGYFFVQGSCYQQGPCMQGYAFVTPTGMCYRIQ